MGKQITSSSASHSLEMGMHSISVCLHVEEYATPPIHDALVLGKRNPIGCSSIRQALTFLRATPFTHIVIEDDVISDIIVRESILMKIEKDKLIKLIIERVKPLMTDEEIMHLDIEVRIRIEDVV